MGREPVDSQGLDAVFAGLELRRRRVLRSIAGTVLGLGVLLPLTSLPVALMFWVGADHAPGSLGARLAEQFPRFVELYQGILPFGVMGWIGGGLFGSGFCVRQFALKPRWAYLHAYKQRVFTVVCRERFPGLHYEPGEGIGWPVFDGSGLFPFESDVYGSEDRFSGRWRQTEVCFAEAWAERKVKRWRNGERRTEYEEYFRGILFIADFHKHFHSTTRIVPNGEKGRRSWREKRAELEDPGFEAAFDVYTTDQVDVRYVLSTSTMARLFALTRRFPGLRARLADERLLLLLPSPRRQFEPALLRRAANPAQVERFVQDVEACLSVVDALDLDTRIWSKH